LKIDDRLPSLLAAPILLSLLLILWFTSGISPSHVSTITAPQCHKADTNAIGLPVRLIIPAINVDTSIESLGVTTKGEMEVPDNIFDVGWFKFGSRPGENGSAVIAGHLNGTSGEAGIFADLSKLKEGDRVYIDNDQGIQIPFVVRNSRSYDPGFADDVFSRSDGVHLNLITCEGVWNKVKRSYDKRLVVSADIVR
jgi:LPXTG-site transpeptidase (sortase) family protein